MKKILVINTLALVFANVVIGAVGPINWGNTTHVKRLNYSPALPIDLFQSTDGAGGHENKYFAARTLYRLGPGPAPAGLSEYEQKKLRNEICASERMYVAAPNAAALDIPGSLGVYLHEDRVVSVSDTGITGERLDSVLRKLSRENTATKTAVANYYATAMVRNLVLIHAGNVIWNNVDLRNFYTRPNGGLYAVDFSEARATTADAAGAAAKATEIKDFATRVLRDMYLILFPTPAEATTAYETFTDPNPRATAWDQAAIIARLQAVLAGANQNETLLTSGLNGDFAANALAYLNHQQNIPSVPVVAFPSIVKTDHAANVADQMIYSNVAIGPFVSLLAGVAVGADKAALCAGWTGIE